jgi:hypothetical protein
MEHLLELIAGGAAEVQHQPEGELHVGGAAQQVQFEPFGLASWDACCRNRFWAVWSNRPNEEGKWNKGRIAQMRWALRYWNC